MTNEDYTIMYQKLKKFEELDKNIKFLKSLRERCVLQLLEVTQND